jgi:DNA-binding beta-propeller fold protein YncE
MVSAPVQDAAAASLGEGKALLLGGLTAADTSTDGIILASRGGARSVGKLPVALHDSAATRLGSFVYLFGGGTASGQLDQIVQVAPKSGVTRLAGRLPAPSSDQAAASLEGTAYVVGGYTGRSWLDTIVAWRPGLKASVVAHLPTPVRYAAVAAVGERLVIAGGSLPDGTASDAVYAFDSDRRRLQLLGRLPSGTTHAAAAPIGSTVFVIGGRGADRTNRTDRIVAVDPVRGRIHIAGRLTSARSDLAAAPAGGRILLVGGAGSTGTQASISELVPQTAVVRVATPRRTPVQNGFGVSVYAHDGLNMLSPVARSARSLVYVPDSASAAVDVIDPRTFKVIEHFPVGLLPQHVVPAWDLKTLYVTNDIGNSLTTIDPFTGKPGSTIFVDDPYNMYFTPDGRFAIVVAERLRRLDFRDAHTFQLRHSLVVPCLGVDHMDFAADGSYAIASCEFSGQLVKVDIARQRVIGLLDLPDGRGGMPQDVRVSPDGKIFYVADLAAGGVWKVDGTHLKVIGFVKTGRGAHGIYPSRDGTRLYVSNRDEGSISVISFRTRTQIEKWWLPGGGSPDMGGVSADGKTLWLSGRHDSVVYAISTSNGRLIARIPVGYGPHGLLVWPQPGRYSLGHTGNMR